MLCAEGDYGSQAHAPLRVHEGATQNAANWTSPEAVCSSMGTVRASKTTCQAKGLWRDQQRMRMTANNDQFSCIAACHCFTYSADPGVTRVAR
jgi:hypothetical protein